MLPLVCDLKNIPLLSQVNPGTPRLPQAHKYLYFDFATASILQLKPRLPDQDSDEDGEVQTLGDYTISLNSLRLAAPLSYLTHQYEAQLTRAKADKAKIAQRYHARITSAKRKEFTEKLNSDILEELLKNHSSTAYFEELKKQQQQRQEWQRQEAARKAGKSDGKSQLKGQLKRISKRAQNGTPEMQIFQPKQQSFRAYAVAYRQLSICRKESDFPSAVRLRHLLAK